MKPSCSSCAHAFREEWSRDTDALRCGYKARTEERAPARADGVPMMKPQSAYGRVTQLFPKGKEACVEGNARQRGATGIIYPHSRNRARCASCLPGTASQH